ncbi:hypothetical protein K0M31_016859 [Melipona bicolor]|uniref:Uncharacterized protein n=1 Tax=Melipona bicolor TaxID=60889 RepID=A0AA40FEE4_9HYME|nr:hypothetical protein K0M31_016859 [Melipona bicolor]
MEELETLESTECPECPGPPPEFRLPPPPRPPFLTDGTFCSEEPLTEIEDCVAIPSLVRRIQSSRLSFLCLPSRPHGPEDCFRRISPRVRFFLSVRGLAQWWFRVPRELPNTSETLDQLFLGIIRGCYEIASTRVWRPNREETSDAATFDRGPPATVRVARRQGDVERGKKSVMAFFFLCIGRVSLLRLGIRFVSGRVLESRGRLQGNSKEGGARKSEKRWGREER